MADRIADAYGQTEQRSTYCPYKNNGASIWSVTGLARWLARPCCGEIAPVFWGYIIAMAFLIAHLFLLIFS